MSQELLVQAQNSLGLSLVTLYASEVATGTSFPSYEDGMSLNVLNKRNFERKEVSKDRVRYYYKFGVMLLPEGIDAENATEDNLHILIEAGYIAEYHIHKKISDKALQAFGETNAPYHLWTYWREYVQSTLSRLGMPPLTLPMLLPQAHNTKGKKAKIPTKKKLAKPAKK